MLNAVYGRVRWVTVTGSWYIYRARPLTRDGGA